MTLPAAPPQGHMYLFDSATPPLTDGSYRATVATDVSTAGVTPTFQTQRYFDVVGPRFSVPTAMVAACFPPANGHGAFQNALPQIVLTRRTLPWERLIVGPGTSLGTANPPPVAVTGDAPPLPDTAVPWVALLLFEEGEYTFYRNLPLEQVVPAAVFQSMGQPAGITCDAVEATAALIASLLPSRQELQLLAHVRWVNVEDRELNIAWGDGFFSVVVSNRLPTAGGQFRAVLVSLEGRSDIVQENPPATAPDGTIVATEGTISARVAIQPPLKPVGSVIWDPQLVRLIALTSWQFTCAGPGTFQQLMQNLSNAMFGSVADPGQPPLTDTGHLPISLQDRLGATEQVLYRGPLVPYALTRDALGPYHSADQARRVSPDTGTEDIAYAAAFEVGRLLAAADPRLAQSLMSWRRAAYQQSARASTITDIAQRAAATLPATMAEMLHTPIAPILSSAATTAVVKSAPPIADAYGLTTVAGAPGLNATTLAAAWNLASPAQAAALLGGDPGSLGGVVTSEALTTRSDTTLAAVAADAAGLSRLTAARDQAVQSAAASGSL